MNRVIVENKEKSTTESETESRKKRRVENRTEIERSVG
jgi:hypothetical protein